MFRRPNKEKFILFKRGYISVFLFKRRGGGRKLKKGVSLVVPIK